MEPPLYVRTVLEYLKRCLPLRDFVVTGVRLSEETATRTDLGRFTAEILVGRKLALRPAVACAAVVHEYVHLYLAELTGDLVYVTWGVVMTAVAPITSALTNALVDAVDWAFAYSTLGMRTPLTIAMAYSWSVAERLISRLEARLRRHGLDLEEIATAPIQERRAVGMVLAAWAQHEVLRRVRWFDPIRPAAERIEERGRLFARLPLWDLADRALEDVARRIEEKDWHRAADAVRAAVGQIAANFAPGEPHGAEPFRLVRSPRTGRLYLFTRVFSVLRA